MCDKYDIKKIRNLHYFAIHVTQGSSYRVMTERLQKQVHYQPSFESSTQCHSRANKSASLALQIRHVPDPSAYLKKKCQPDSSGSRYNDRNDAFGHLFLADRSHFGSISDRKRILLYTLLDH